MINRPIFLHFMNRELRETERVQFSDEQLIKFISLGAVITSEFMYLGDAIVWECLKDYPKTAKLLIDLEKYSFVRFVGTDSSIDTFLEKRQRLYKFDKKRYPIYFSDDIRKMPWATNHYTTESDTTIVLARDFHNAIENEHSFPEKDKRKLEKALVHRRRNGSAITYSLFKRYKLSDKQTIQRFIIDSYNKRYLDIFDGSLITGINGLSYYDKDCYPQIYSDYYIHNKILEKFGLFRNIANNSERFLTDLLELKQNDRNYSLLFEEINKICSGIKNVSNFNLYELTKISIDNTSSFDNRLESLWRFSLNLSEKNIDYKRGYYMNESKNYKILLLAASPLEYKTLRGLALERGYKYTDKTDSENEEFSYAECMERTNKKLYIAYTDMGSTHAGSTIHQLLNTLKPSYVIMGGICAGLEKDKQKIGQILVSSNIIDGNIAKETTNGSIPRGQIIEASGFLKTKFLIESYEDKYQVDFCQIYSKDVLANSKEFIDRVKKDYPDAKGYEMEGAGLINVCKQYNTGWILVKSICDWGFDKKDSDQATAAHNSYSFIFDVLDKGW